MSVAAPADMHSAETAASHGGLSLDQSDATAAIVGMTKRKTVDVSATAESVDLDAAGGVENAFKRPKHVPPLSSSSSSLSSTSSSSVAAAVAASEPGTMPGDATLSVVQQDRLLHRAVAFTTESEWHDLMGNYKAAILALPLVQRQARSVRDASVGVGKGQI
jgi:hypothetical protein